MPVTKMPESQTIRVSIMGKTYQVSCKKDEVAALQRSATFLDEKMKEMKKRSSTGSLDNLAIMAALNLTNDLLTQVDEASQLSSRESELADQLVGQAREIKQLEEKLTSALSRLKPEVKVP